MGNANDAVKAAAWYVTGDVDEGGLVKALEEFGLLD
jgi:hydroxymethylpyrimidine pyrophosphatase-like HAD family hydrolase